MFNRAHVDRVMLKPQVEPEQPAHAEDKAKSASHESSPVTNRRQADRGFQVLGPKNLEIIGPVGQNFVSGHSPDTLKGGAPIAAPLGRVKAKFTVKIVVRYSRQTLTYSVLDRESGFDFWIHSQIPRM